MSFAMPPIALYPPPMPYQHSGYGYSQPANPHYWTGQPLWPPVVLPPVPPPPRLPMPYYVPNTVQPMGASVRQSVTPQKPPTPLVPTDDGFEMRFGEPLSYSDVVKLVKKGSVQSYSSAYSW